MRRVGPIRAQNDADEGLCRQHRGDQRPDAQDGVVRIGGFIVAQRNGKNFGSIMRAMFQEISEAAGIKGLQARDLRRTAMVRLAEAGCTDIQIAAISGHTIDRTRQILETYVVRTEAMGEAAIELWERNEAENV